MREFRVVKRWHGDVLANKGEPSSRFYIIHRQAPTTPPPCRCGSRAPLRHIVTSRRRMLASSRAAYVGILAAYVFV